MVIEETTRMSYKEVYRIIENSTEEIQAKIPRKFMEFLKSIMSKDYEPDLDYSKPLNEQHLMEETIIVMAVIYRDYLCTQEERARLIMEEQGELERHEEEKRQKYNPDNIFKNKTRNLEFTAQEKDEIQDLTVIKKEGFIKKLLNKIKSFLFK